MSETNCTFHPLDALHGVWHFQADTNGYLIVRNGQSLLIDCPGELTPELLQAHGLPAPQLILHPHVQDEHCQEWQAWPEVPVYVAADSVEVARRSAAFIQACSTIWPPSREWELRGEESYGVAGCTTERPPEQPLAVAGTLTPGTAFTWQDITLEILALPGSGKRALGFFWREAGLLFAGDLLHAGGFLVNFYDLERSYGIPSGYDQLFASLDLVAQCAPRMLCPSTGPVSADPLGDCARLRTRCQALLSPTPRRTTDRYALTNFSPRREFGRYREVLLGLYQNTNFGNIVLYVDGDGRGVIVDPDPCVWSTWEDNCRDVHADLDLLERETGLRCIDRALITHYHGDHVQYCDLLRARYGTRICATPDVAAVMERPADYRYPCTIDWYGFPFAQIDVDEVLAYETPFAWGETSITPLHTPGHCFAHTGFLIPWHGHRTLCTGDTLQYGQGPMAQGLPVLYNDTAWPDRGLRATYARLCALRPDLVLGGHSHAFFDADGSILRDLAAVAREAESRAAALVPPGGDLCRMMTPPGYDAKRPSLAVRSAGSGI